MRGDKHAKMQVGAGKRVCLLAFSHFPFNELITSLVSV